MKKLIPVATVIAALMCISATAQDVPAFDNPRAVVLDTSTVPGSMKDNVKLINLSEDENISFTVHAYVQKSKNKPGEWQTYGSGYLKEFYDGDTIDSPLEDKIKNIRYFAIAPDAKGDYKYTIEKKRNDLYINVFSANESKDESYKRTAYIFNVQEVPGVFKDNFKFSCKTQDTNISFTVYVFNDKNEKWQKAGVGTLKGFGDTDTVSSPLKGTLHNYTYVGIVSRNGKAYTYDVTKANNDIIITVK
ncbi:MAG: hypothetical protein J6I73_10490 [Treponema sp.]|nr:hypothetical protein [Treponema sp.]